MYKSMTFLMVFMMSLAHQAWSEVPTNANIGKLHSELLKKFTPVEQKDEDDEWPTWTGFEKEFHGDCDDYAVAAANRIAYKEWPMQVVTATSRATNVRHAFACTKNTSGLTACLDNLSAEPQSWSEVASRYKRFKKTKWKVYKFQ